MKDVQPIIDAAKLLAPLPRAVRKLLPPDWEPSEVCWECGRGPGLLARLCGRLGHRTVLPRSVAYVTPYRWRCLCGWVKFSRWGG